MFEFFVAFLGSVTIGLGVTTLLGIFVRCIEPDDADHRD